VGSKGMNHHIEVSSDLAFPCQNLLPCPYQCYYSLYLHWRNRARQRSLRAVRAEKVWPVSNSHRRRRGNVHGLSHSFYSARGGVRGDAARTTVKDVYVVFCVFLGRLPSQMSGLGFVAHRAAIPASQFQEALRFSGLLMLLYGLKPMDWDTVWKFCNL
jgi:hypothetical protein